MKKLFFSLLVSSVLRRLSSQNEMVYSKQHAVPIVNINNFPRESVQSPTWRDNLQYSVSDIPQPDQFLIFIRDSTWKAQTTREGSKYELTVVNLDS